MPARGWVEGSVLNVTDHSPTITGWREWVSLQSIGIAHTKAKIDTGARTSSLHATGVERFQRGEAEWVRFSVHPWQSNDLDAVEIELPVVDRRAVRSSSGHEEERVVVSMEVSLVGRTCVAEVTLTDRDEMEFRMLIGREALRNGFVVDPAASFLGGQPTEDVLSRNGQEGEEA